MSVRSIFRIVSDPFGSAAAVTDALRRTRRYTLVGAACAAAYNGIMIFGTRAGADYISLSLVAFLFLTPVGYLLHARYTFGIPRSLNDFARFASSNAASFPIYFVVIAVLCSGFHLSVPVAAPTTTVVMYLWNYASTHWALRSWLPFGNKTSTTRVAASFESKDTRHDGTHAVPAISE